MAIYTRTGDKGQTSLMGGQRVLKSAKRVEAYGTVDELNSAIGIAIAELVNVPPHSGEPQSATPESSAARPSLPAGRDSGQARMTKDLSLELTRIQNDLLDVGSALATPEGLPVEHLEKRPKEFEKLIDSMTEKMPKLTQFILPGGGKAGSALHLARTICRRAERRVVALIQDEEVDQAIVIYLNRLSDLLFTMARYVNHTEKQKETVWKKA